MQYGGFQDAFNRNMQNKNQMLGTLTGIMGAGQNAATNQGNWDYGAGNTLSNILQNNGQQQAGYQLQQGQIAANQAANINNSVQGLLSNVSFLGSLYGMGNKVGGGGTPYTDLPYGDGVSNVGGGNGLTGKNPGLDKIF